MYFQPREDYIYSQYLLYIRYNAQLAKCALGFAVCLVDDWPVLPSPRTKFARRVDFFSSDPFPPKFLSVPSNKLLARVVCLLDTAGFGHHV